MSQIYRLKFPVTQKLRTNGGPLREEVIEEVTLRRAKAKDLRLLDAHEGNFGRSLTLLGALSGLSRTAIDELDAEDVKALGDIASDFFPDLLATGEPSSET